MRSDWDANEIVQKGLGIVSDILSDGVVEWAEPNTQDGDDWEIIDRLRAEDDFASSCLYALNDVATRVEIVPIPVAEAFDAARIAIVATLVKSAAGTVESLICSWSDEERSEVPSLLAGQEACEAWLAKYNAKEDA